MREIFYNIAKSYINARNEKFANNALSNFIRNVATETIQNEVFLDKEKYTVKGSAGQGQWAEVPWIAIFDKDITVKATEGYDIVYLFRADMKGVYISLNQGWTFYKKKYGSRATSAINTVSEKWKKVLCSYLDDFSFEKINLNSNSKNSDLAKGYELGHICGKYYEIDNLPDDATLKSDLVKLIGVYRELKGKLQGLSISEINEFLVSDASLSWVEDEHIKQENVLVNLALKDKNNVNINVVKASTIGKKEKSGPKKIDFELKSKRQAIIGLAGEKIVLEYEKRELIKAGKVDLAAKVSHISLVDDSRGFDILSYTQDGDEKYIEVKTTTKNEEEGFYITANELQVSKEESDKYYIYRLFNLDIEHSKCDMCIYSGCISNIFDLEPLVFKVTGVRCK